VFDENKDDIIENDVNRSFKLFSRKWLCCINYLLFIRVYLSGNLFASQFC